MTIHTNHDGKTIQPQAPEPQAPQTTPHRYCILVCQHRSCLRMGSDQVLKAFQSYLAPNLMVSASSCLGLCGGGPNVRIIPDDIWYCRVRPDDVPIVFEQHLQQGKPVQRLLHPRIHPQYDAYSYNTADTEEAGSDSEV